MTTFPRYLASLCQPVLGATRAGTRFPASGGAGGDNLSSSCAFELMDVRQDSVGARRQAPP